MKKITWRKHHKWIGLLLCFFLVMCCVSGILLNHRTLIADVNIDRKWLPQSYHYKDWNSGLLRGSLAWTDQDSTQSVLIYGSSGMWNTHKKTLSFTDFNNGLPQGADYRAVRGVVQVSTGPLFAAAQWGLYRYDISDPQHRWQKIDLPATEDESRLTDIRWGNDTLVVLSRSHLYYATAPYTHFNQLSLAAPPDYTGKVSLFRTIWLVHSGELFGLAGKILMDLIAVALIVLCVTGLILWITKKRKGHAQLLKQSLSWHDFVGRKTIVLTLFVALTGWCLRPPVLLALVKSSVPPIPGTTLSSDNPWNDKLRMVQYDETSCDWILSTSEGMYSLANLKATPQRLHDAPPVSVMGLNVFQKNEAGHWLIGSLGGLFEWDRTTQKATDYFTQEPAPQSLGAPFGNKAVSGFSNDFGTESSVVLYDEGTPFPPMPQSMSTLPMSLWNVALEVHTGRIYTFLSQGTLLFTFFFGALSLWLLWSGWVLRRRKKTSGGLKKCKPPIKYMYS